MSCAQQNTSGGERLLEVFYCNAEAAGFEPANRLRAVNCFRGSLLQPLGHASLNIPSGIKFRRMRCD